MSFCGPLGAGRRQQLNILTSYIDASMVYGSTKEEADSLRDPDTGKIYTSQCIFLSQFYWATEGIAFTIYKYEKNGGLSENIY